MQPTETGIAIPQQSAPSAVLAHPAPAWMLGSSGPNFFTSLKPANEQERAALASALMAPTGRVEDLIGKTIRLTHVVCQPTETVDEGTGEVVPLVRTILITDDGSSYACSSGGILRSLQMLYTIYGSAPWSPGLPLEVQQQSLKSGHRIFRLAPVLMAKAVGGKGVK